MIAWAVKRSSLAFLSQLMVSFVFGIEFFAFPKYLIEKNILFIDGLLNFARSKNNQVHALFSISGQYFSDSSITINRTKSRLFNNKKIKITGGMWFSTSIRSKKNNS